MIRILLVDDQKSIREVLRVVLDLDTEMKVVGTASDGYTAIEQVEILKPDLVLIDIEMPGLNGFNATKSICQAVPGTKVLILSMHRSEEYVSKSLEVGAIGYLVKNTPARELRESIRFIFNDHIHQSPQGVEDWWESATTQEPHNGHAPSNAYANGNGRKQLLRVDGADNSQVSSRIKQPSRTQPTQFPIPDQPIPKQIGGLIQDEIPQGQKTFSILWVLGALIGIGAIWGLSLLYLWKTPSTYTSQWSITLPSAGSSAFVNLPDIGQATSSDESPYNSQASDPRETYKSLVLTDEVIDQAAAQLEITTQDFGEPRVQVVLNTTLMKFQISGLSPQFAQKKAIALHNAFEERLDQLRFQEVNEKDQNLEVILEDANEKLAIARNKLTQFQIRTGLESSEQLRDLSQSTELLRRQKAEVSAQLEQVAARSRRLSSDIGLSIAEVSDAFILDSDALFQQYLTNFNQARAAVVSLKTQFNSTHPAVLDQIDSQNSAKQALLEQGQITLRKPITLNYIRKLSLQTAGDRNSNRETLFQDLLSLKNQEKGFSEQFQELARQITQFEEKLKILSSQNATLVKLERDVKIAEAIFSSTITRQDLSQTNSSASYPPISIVTKPNLPREPSSPNPKFVYLGALVSSLFLCSGIIALWWHSRKSAQRHRQSSAIISLSKGV